MRSFTWLVPVVLLLVATSCEYESGFEVAMPPEVLTTAAPVLAAPFEQANFEFFSGYLRGIKQQPPRWKTAGRTLRMSESWAGPSSRMRCQ